MSNRQLDPDGVMLILEKLELYYPGQLPFCLGLKLDPNVLNCGALQNAPALLMLPPLSSLSKSSPLGVELIIGHPSSQSPSLYSPGEPFHGPECSEGLSVHSPTADSTCCRLSSSGASPRAAVHDGFKEGSKTLSGCVDPSHSLNDSSSVGPIHPGALEL
ncbi:hypothetical protein Nepgr_022921 [Nepenthes gracilis]|uniref:Uncharacterized protein n=1 Tax=Nepenthes gracilis TaxID=150966 RepID=A0AAD3T1W0_NEPGR|nr:hypothetical protein Nepgr_022921 [Nepenthes gracilis]